jgi:hypothetical protein
MGGSGGGPFSSSRSPEDLARLVRESERVTSVVAFEAELSALLGELLGEINNRDRPLVKERLEELKLLLEDSIEESLDVMFGGSVAKRTYVDGLSDIDSLLIVDGTELEDGGPEAALARMAEVLSEGLNDDIHVEQGRMAVTVAYPDGMSIQLLPAVRTADGLKIPSSRHSGWSSIEPRGFQQALTRTNEACAGKLVPTVKLAKAILGTLPEHQRLSGYHIESLAIAAFRSYLGPCTTAEMLPTLFERAKELVLSPIKDRTGQSLHVDEYLGVANSQARLSASHLLNRLAKRMRNATAAGSKEQWLALFEIEL